jgi:hypothetical protein
MSAFFHKYGSFLIGGALACLVFAGLALLNAGEIPAPPAISFEHQAEFYRADGAMVRAQAAVIAAQKDLQEATVAVIADCGDQFAPGQDPGNPKRLACVPKGK